MVAIIRAWRIVPCILSLAFERLIRVCFTTIFPRLFSLATRNEKFFQFSSHSFFWVGGSKGKGKQSSRWSRKSLKSEKYSSWLTSKGAGEAFTLRISCFGARFIDWNSLLTRNFCSDIWWEIGQVRIGSSDGENINVFYGLDRFEFELN